MKIKTSHDYPPIPDRSMDWSAVDSDTYDGAPDSSNRDHVGRGHTEAEAIEDLIATLLEKNPDEIVRRVRNYDTIEAVLRGLLFKYEGFQASDANQQEAYCRLVKYASGDWLAAKVALTLPGATP